MNTLKNYKREIKKLFYLSVKSDINKWTGGVARSTDFDSPSYKSTSFLIKRNYGDRSILFFRNNYEEGIKICKITIFNFKMWRYLRKLKLHFKKEVDDKKNSIEIEYLKTGIERVQSNFIKEIRKEKLIQIEK